MIGIREIATYIPQAFESNLDKLEKFKITEDFIAEKIGVRRVSRRAPDEDTSDLCLAALEKLKAKTDLDLSTIDCIILCSQNPDENGLPHTSARLHGRLGLSRRCAAFDVSLGCSGFVYTLSIAKAFMEANGMKRGLLFTADPYSKILDPDDKNTVLLFGDGAAVTLLTRGAPSRPLLTPVAFDVDSHGAQSSALINTTGRLHMNGRQSATAVPEEIRKVIAGAGLNFPDFDMFLFHQGSKYIVDTVRKRLELPAEKVAEDLTEHGNTVSSTIPILLEPMIHDEAKRRLLLCGFGVGLSTATCILERP